MPRLRIRQALDAALHACCVLLRKRQQRCMPAVSSYGSVSSVACRRPCHVTSTGPRGSRAEARHLCAQVRWAGDRCSVCDSDVDFDFDQLVSCDACGITVHQSCYGVAELPGVDDMWMCRACELKASPGGDGMPQRYLACLRDCISKTRMLGVCPGN